MGKGLAWHQIGVGTRGLVPLQSVWRMFTAHRCADALVAALTGPMDAVESMKAAYRERRDLAVECLNKMPGVRCIVPKGAIYVFPNITGTGVHLCGLPRGCIPLQHQPKLGHSITSPPIHTQMAPLKGGPITRPRS